MENSHFSTLFAELNQDRKGDKRYCDITISVGGLLFPAHRCILGIFCDYFSTLFQTDFKDKYGDIIKISGAIGENISSDVFQLILDFCYTAKTTLNSENVFGVLSGAEFLQISRLKNQCGKFLMTSITPENWLSIYRIGAKLNHEDLLNYCLNDFVRKEEDIDITKFNFDEFHAVIKYVSKKLECTKILQIIVNWMKNCREDHKQQYFDKVVQYIDYKQMSQAFLIQNVYNNPLFMNSVTALQGLVAQKLQEPCPSGMMVLGGNTSNSSKSVEKYSVDTNLCSRYKCPDLPKGCFRSAVASNDSHIFVVGGQSCNGGLQVYVKNEDKWLLQENLLKYPRYGGTATVVDNKLCVFGGLSGPTTYLSSIEVFAITENTCFAAEYLSDLKLKAARCDHASVTKDKTVYVLGGYNGDRLSKCESIDFSNGLQKDIADMQAKRDDFAAVIYDDCIFAIGGGDSYAKRQSVESYSFATNQWSEMPSMKLSKQLFEHSACVNRNSFYVFGGNGTGGNFEVYNAETSKWEVVGPLFIPRERAYVVTF